VEISIRVVKMNIKGLCFTGVLCVFSTGLWAAEIVVQERYSFPHCAAYFFNATKASTVGQYEELYQLGETAVGLSQRVLTNEETEFQMAEASEKMTNIIERDWRKFEVLREMYDLPCRTLLLDAAKG